MNQQKKQYRILFLLLATIFALQSCVPTRHVPKGEHLLVKNKITIEKDKEVKITTAEMLPIIKQKPNRKILFLFRFHLGVYNFAVRKNKENSSKFRLWLRETIGEPPVILNDNLTEKSRNQLEQYAKNKGYFNASVTDTVVYKKKKAKVFYHLKPHDPYTIRKITFSISDTALIKPIREATKGTLMKPGANFDVYMIAKERDRMEKAMQNQGYYDFLKEYVYFEADSTIEDRKVNVKLVVKNPNKQVQLSNGEDSIVEKKHEVYYINQVYINASYDPTTPGSVDSDTIMDKGYIFMNASKLQFRTEVLAKNVFIKPGEKYAAKNSDYTYDRLAGLKTFKFINISYDEVPSKNGKNQLNCYVDLSRVPKQSFTVELTGTHRGGNLGIATGYSYKNKNTFKGAEILQIKLNAGVEATKVISENNSSQVSDEVNENDSEPSTIPFNTLDIGPEVSLFIPKLLFPKRLSTKLPKYQNPTTDVTLRYSYQTRSEFKRTLTSGSFSYSFKTGEHRSWIISPIDVSLLNITFTDSVFREQLLSTGNSFLLNSYSDHLLIGSRLSFIYSNQTTKPKNFVYSRTNLEGTGNLLRALSPSIGLKQDENDNYLLFDVPFAQYIRLDSDLRLYRRITKTLDVVYRMYGGIGIPFENLGVLPFEKSFFAGGSNGIRAWQARELGPGGLSDTAVTSGIDQIGDIKLEWNIEYRFDLTKILEGALFVDAGNIWLLQKDTNRLNAEFNFNRFYQEIAFGTGFGFRFDFNFFILRLDIGFPLKDPGLPLGERWITQPKTNYNTTNLRLAREELDRLEQELDNAQSQQEMNNLKEDIQAQNQFISSNSYRYTPKLVFNLGIGYPF